MKIAIITTALALSVVAAAPQAHAADTQAQADAKTNASVDGWFEKYDRNKDGLITVEEFSMGKSYFHALDLDKNGTLTREEAKAALAKTSKAAGIDWQKMDTDQDGYITVREWTGTPEEFDAADLDHDRVLSSYDRALGRELKRAAGRLKSYDKNNDGFISSDEWPADIETFRQRDRNRDGKLSVEELAEDVKRKES